MLGQLGSLRRRCQRLPQGFFLRGIATEKQGRRHQPAPPPPPEPPEKIEWWAVDGELVKAEKFDPKRILSPLENEHISNKRRRKDLIRQLTKTRLKLRIHKQDSYWAAYMKRFQILRDEWEKHVWDPIPIPQPRRRHPTWVAEETQKYVWQDPRREAYAASAAGRNAAQGPHQNAYTFDLSRMDQTAVRSRFDEKIGYKGQGMSHSPYENRRNPGASSARPGMMPFRQGNVDFAHRRLRPATEFEDFDDVFNNEDTNRTQAEAKPSLSSEDESDSEDVQLFNWEESSSEEDSGCKAKATSKVDGTSADDDDDEDDDDSVDESEVKGNEQRKKGWFGDEDDLFKDDE